RGLYSEDDVPAPVNVYARSKLDGERAVRESMPGALVVRTNFIGLPAHPGAGLGDWIASSIEAGTPIRGFDDVIFSPLLATTLAQLLFDMMDANLTGLFHLGARDSVSKYELAVAIERELGNLDPKIERAFSSDQPMAVRRPLDTSLLSTRAENALGRQMPTVLEAVRGFIAERSEQTA
ncbi:MAG: sugar nucleotide-binding protein, partial [Gemmatimonadaceae bacterium]